MQIEISENSQGIELGDVCVSLSEISNGKYRLVDGTQTEGWVCSLVLNTARDPIVVGGGSLFSAGTATWQVVQITKPEGTSGSISLRKLEERGPWLIKETVQVYQDHWLALRKDFVIRPDRKDGTYCIVDLMPGVCVLAVDEELNVYLTEEFHYGVGRVTLEGVSGGIEECEGALGTAKRELREELGIDAVTWDDLGMVDPFTGSIVSPTRLFLARGLIFGATNPEGTELIRSVKMSLDEAVRCVIDSEITHGPSCVLILKAARFLAS